MGFAATPFRFWRGSIEVRIQIVASRFHRGRLRFAWTPDGNAVSASETNLNYGRIIDIDQTSQFEFVIPFGRNVGYCYCDPSSLVTQRDAVNGQVYLSVQNPLSNPEASKDVSILVWVRAGEDLEFAGPTFQHYQASAPYAMQSSSQAPGMREDVGITRETVREELWEASNHPMLNTVYVGDPVHSFRPLLKRYERLGVLWDNSTSENASSNVPVNTVMFKVLGIPFYPPVRGQCATGFGSYNVAGAATYDWNPWNMVLMNWLGSAYVGQKGSVRWAVTNPYSSGDARLPSISDVQVARVYSGKSFSNGDPSNFPNITLGYQFPNLNDVDGIQDIENSLGHDALGGVQYFSADHSVINVEWPPYNNNRFFPTLWSQRPDLPQLPRVHPDGCSVIVYRGGNSSTTDTARNSTCCQTLCVAAGEDFQYLGWRGVPPMEGVSAAVYVNGLVSANVDLI
jgi:hypothetical protein